MQSDRRVLLWGLVPVLLGLAVQPAWVRLRCAWEGSPNEELFDVLPVMVGLLFPFVCGAGWGLLRIIRGASRRKVETPRMAQKRSLPSACLAKLLILESFITVLFEALASLLEKFLILLIGLLAVSFAVWLFINFPVHVGVIVLVLLFFGK